MSDDLALRYGGPARIVFAHGPAAPALQALCGAAGAARVVANRRHEPAMTAADGRTAAALQAAGIEVRCCADAHPPGLCVRCAHVILNMVCVESLGADAAPGAASCALTLPTSPSQHLPSPRHWRMHVITGACADLFMHLCPHRVRHASS